MENLYEQSLNHRLVEALDDDEKWDNTLRNGMEELAAEISALINRHSRVDAPFVAVALKMIAESFMAQLDCNDKIVADDLLKRSICFLEIRRDMNDKRA